METDIEVERDRLYEDLEQLGPQIPALLTHRSKPQIFPEKEVQFRSERITDNEQEKLSKKKREAYFQRTMNSFFLSEHIPKNGQCTMVAPDFRKEDTDRNRPNYLVGFACPVIDGARRSARSLAGYTPLYAGQSHSNLWQMQTKVVGAWVGTPYMGDVDFYGCKIPCIIFQSWDNQSIQYAVQNPDSRYRPYWEATIASWAVEHERGDTKALVPWKDVDLNMPRVWWMPDWCVRVLRLEHGLPPENPDDSKRRAMLGGCREIRPVKNRRAPCTEEEWRAIPIEASQPGDDEAGESDAGSINDDVEMGLPTSSHWDPETKKSTTPRGTEPHPHMDVVESELRRNREYDARMARARSRKGASTARGRGRPSRSIPSTRAESNNSAGPSRQAMETGSSGTFAPPPPNAPTTRMGLRSGSRSDNRGLNQTRRYTAETE